MLAGGIVSIDALERRAISRSNEGAARLGQPNSGCIPARVPRSLHKPGATREVVCDATGKEGEAGKEGRQGTAPAPSPSLPGSSFHPLLADLLRGNKRDHFEAFGAFDELVRRAAIRCLCYSS